MLGGDEITLAEALKSAGYVTGGFSANGFIGQSLGFAQGFDRYEAHLLTEGDDPTYLRVPRRAERMAADALGWLDVVAHDHPQGVPVFLYLHLMEPHSPYAPRPDQMARVRGARTGVDLRRASETMFIDTLAPVDPERLGEIADAYDASVLAADEALRGFFTGLARGQRLIAERMADLVEAQPSFRAWLERL